MVNVAPKPQVEDLSIDAELTEWFNAEQQRKHWIAEEMRLRMAIFNKAFPTPKPGTNRRGIGHGKDLIAKHGFNYSVDRAGLEAGREFIPAETFAAVINYRPEVRDGAFRALGDNEKGLFSGIITQKPASPQMEIGEKAKRGGRK